VNPSFIRALVQQRLAEHPGYHRGKVWMPMVLERGLQRHRPAFTLRA